MTEAMAIALMSAGVAVFGILGTLGGTLGATALANKSRKTERDELRRREERDAARIAILDLLSHARRWIEVVAPHGQVMLTKQTHEQRREYLKSVPDREEIERSRDDFIRAATNAQRLVGDQMLCDLIDGLVGASGYWVTDLLLSSYTDPRAGIVGRTPRDGEWEEKEAVFKKYLEALVSSAQSRTGVKSEAKDRSRN